MAKAFTFTRDDLLREIADITGGRCLLAFSRGKDSIAAWLELRESGLFPEIVPFHLDGCPGMAFIEESLQYYEDVFGCHIHRLTHPSFLRMLGNCIFQPPERVEVIRRLRLHECTRIGYNDVRRWLAEDLGWPEATTWTATGVLAADSGRRRIHIVKSRGRTWSSQQFFPIYDYAKSDPKKVADRHGIKLPPDYAWFKRSFDGVDARFSGPLREHNPADYEIMKFWFPLCDLDLMRQDMINKDKANG